MEFCELFSPPPELAGRNGVECPSLRRLEVVPPTPGVAGRFRGVSHGAPTTDEVFFRRMLLLFGRLRMVRTIP